MTIGCRYAGILMGISHTIANIAGFIAPDVVGNLTEKNVKNLYFLFA